MSLKVSQATDDQKAALALAWRPQFEPGARERKREHGGTAPGRKKSLVADSPQVLPENQKTRSKLAAMAEVTEHKIRQAEQVEKAAPAPGTKKPQAANLGRGR